MGKILVYYVDAAQMFLFIHIYLCCQSFEQFVHRHIQTETAPSGTYMKLYDRKSVKKAVERSIVYKKCKKWESGNNDKS